MTQTIICILVLGAVYAVFKYVITHRYCRECGYLSAECEWTPWQETTDPEGATFTVRTLNKHCVLCHQTWPINRQSKSVTATGNDGSSALRIGGQ